MIEEFTDWLLAQGLARSTVRTRLTPLRMLAREYELPTLTPRQVDRWIAARAHLRPETRKSYVIALKIFAKWAKKNGYLPKNVARNLAAPRIPKTYSRPCPDWRFEHAMITAPIDVQAMLALGRYAGLRLTEISTLRLSDRIAPTRLHIIGKGGRERLVPINLELAEILDELEELRTGEEFYFPGRFARSGGPGHLHPQSVEKIIVRHLGMHPHSLRHAAATAAFQKTHDLQAVQRFLGHSSIATTERYLAMADWQLDAVAEATRTEEHLLAA